MNYELLKRLCDAHGVSGFEKGVHELIIKEIYDFSDEIYYDKVGNLIAFKRGKSSDKKILYSCHADEVGFVINHINDDGTLGFDAIGMSSKVFCGKKVLIGKKRIPGIIATKPVHLIPKDERGKESSADDMYIDIGATKEQALSLGVYADYAVFDTKYCDFGENKIIAKAIDDRFGCAALCSLVKITPEYDSYFAFCIGEELGLRGSYSVANAIYPDLCINVEATTAGDIPGASGEEKTCSMGNGPVIPFMDGGTSYDRSLYKTAISLANEHTIPVQTKTKIAGGTDAASYQRTGGGIPTLGVALATRYIHSGACVADKGDIEAAEKLLNLLYQNTDMFIGGKED